MAENAAQYLTHKLPGEIPLPIMVTVTRPHFENVALQWYKSIISCEANHCTTSVLQRHYYEEMLVFRFEADLISNDITTLCGIAWSPPVQCDGGCVRILGGSQVFYWPWIYQLGGIICAWQDVRCKVPVLIWEWMTDKLTMSLYGLFKAIANS